MKETKRSLLTSATALLLCFVMLIGTTFAWFTDEVTSANNIIKTGTLDISMKWSKDNATWKDTEGAFAKPVFDYDRWEPGYTEVRYIKVENLGSLAFKYQMAINPTGAIGKLAEVIDVSYDIVTDNASFVAPTAQNKQGSLKKVSTLADIIAGTGVVAGGVLLPDGTQAADYYDGEIVICIAFHMQETAGNEYQGASIGDAFGINLYATQYDYENDSFDNSYDDNATWPNAPIVGNTASAPVSNVNGVLENTVTMTSADGKVSATLPAGTKLEQGATEATLSVSDVANSQANITLGAGEAALSVDVHVYGVAEDNDVPTIIYLAEALPVGLNMGNYSLYHVEDGNTNVMTYVSDVAELDVHNEFAYDPATGDVTLCMESFSEVAMVAETPKWEGNFDYEWYDADATELTIANADQLAAFGAIVGGMAEGIAQDSFKDKIITLLSDINLGDKESENNSDIIFYPIGYWNNEGTYERKPLEERVTAVESGFYTFMGTFDGNGHTVSNFYQNTWEMKGDHNWYDPIKEQYYRDGMGLFGRVYGGTVKNITVKNFSSDGEIATTGVIAAYADGATFENIAIFNCNPRVYNIGNGGIVGCVGWYAKEAGLTTTFTNITVDNSNKISALWGSYDVACGGIVGQYYPTSGQTSAGTPKNAGIHFDNCHISAQMDVYNDVCANYQYYAYRYTGMLIGSVRENVTIDGHSYPKMDGITASGCTVHFGTWNDYYYCEFEKNGHPSYSGPDDYKFSRIEHSEINFTDSNGNGIIDTEEEKASVTGCKHEHTEAEDNRCVYLEFNNLVTGYGWGVTSMSLTNMPGVENLDVTHTEQEKSVEKFEGKVESLENNTIYTLGAIFNFVDKGVELVPGALAVGITNLGENNPVSATIVYDAENWANGTITFMGVGTITITIQDYYFCTPTTITVVITEHNHDYDNDCDVDCNECGATREVGDHVYDNACDTTCNECGATREVPNHAFDNDCDTTCNVCGAVRETNHTPGAEATCTTAQTCTVCNIELVAALGHIIVIDEAVDPTCTATGLTQGEHCTRCDYKVAQTVVDKLGHTPGAEATCTTAQTCTVCGEVLVAARGHKYTSVVTKPTCTTEGYTTHTCKCGDTYTDNQTEALGHIETKFTGDFLYRVGNQNAVALSSLFDVGKHSVTVNVANVAGNASVTVNGTSLEFNGTGVVKVTLSADCTCGECDLVLNLEVVDAKNVTSAESATSNNVVLLNDAGLSTIEVKNGYTLYGNGFKLTASGDVAARNMSYGFVQLENGTLDNVQIICPNFAHAILYTKNVDENNNPTDADGRYYNIRSAVVADKNSKITNSYISGGRAAVYASSGTLLIDNSTIEGGAAANIHTGTCYLTLRDVTLIQEPKKATTNGKAAPTNETTLMGVSIFVQCDTNGLAYPITLEGTLNQYAWAHEGYSNYVPEDGQAFISMVLDKDDYIQKVNGKDSVNLGILFMPYDPSMSVKNPTSNGMIIDNRSNAASLTYGVAMINVAYIYSSKTISSENLELTKPSYTPTKQGVVRPSISYTEPNDARVFDTTFDATNNYWVSTLKVDADQGVYAFSFAKLLAQKYGNNLNYTITLADGTEVDKNATITLNDTVVHEYILTITDNSIYGKDGQIISGETEINTHRFKIIATKTSIQSPTWVSTTLSGTHYTVRDTKDSDWNAAVDVLTGLKVKYWSKNQSKEVELNLSDVVSAAKLSAGKQNGTNNSITITVADEYTLVISTTGFKDDPKDNGMPVVVDGKLYFTVASSGHYVSTGTSSRTIYVTYTFTDANNTTPLTANLSKTVQENADTGKDYSKFCSGTLTNASCVTPDTLITLADGSQVRVDSLKGDELLLVWNMETGKFDYAPIMFVDSEAEAEFEVVKLYFSDGTEVKVIGEHGFWDYDLNKYVYLDRYADKYIGHTFAKQNGDKLEKVTLTDVVIETELTTAWSPVTVGHLCYFVNGMLSMPGGVGGLFNIFEVDPETMTYDYEQIAKDIETYGLFTYEELNAICPLTEEMFEAAGGAYLKISIGKGNLTMEELIYMINRYSKYI